MREKAQEECCVQCYMNGKEVLADWNVFWRDPDYEGVLRVSVCEKCYNGMMKEFARNKQKFRSKRIKRRHPFVFR